MIRERVTSAGIRSVSYDPVTSRLVVECAGGFSVEHFPVSYSVYRAIASSRFPERVYRHLLSDKVIPPAHKENQTYPIS